MVVVVVLVVHDDLAIMNLARLLLALDHPVSWALALRIDRAFIHAGCTGYRGHHKS